MTKTFPVYKNGLKDIVTNYRPVSLLSQVSKILEKGFVKRPESFVEKNKSLSDQQHGFRSSRAASSSDGPSKIYQQQQTINNKRSKALDAIHHPCCYRNVNIMD